MQCFDVRVFSQAEPLVNAVLETYAPGALALLDWFFLAHVQVSRMFVAFGDAPEFVLEGFPLINPEQVVSCFLASWLPCSLAADAP